MQLLSDIVLALLRIVKRKRTKCSLADLVCDLLLQSGLGDRKCKCAKHIIFTDLWFWWSCRTVDYLVVFGADNSKVKAGILNTMGVLKNITKKKNSWWFSHIFICMSWLSNVFDLLSLNECCYWTFWYPKVSFHVWLSLHSYSVSKCKTERTKFERFVIVVIINRFSHTFLRFR